MKVLLFSDMEIWEILKLLAALLHMGNVKYRAIVVGRIISFEVLVKKYYTLNSTNKLQPWNLSS